MKIPSAIPMRADSTYRDLAGRDSLFVPPGIKLTSRFLGAIIPCLTGAGYIYQAVATARDRRNYPPTGKLVSVHGHRLHIHTMGSGGPAVVLESGLGGMSSAWGWIQPEAAKATRVVSYDRAGLGWSEPDNAPISASRVARRLHTLLETSGIEGPYVLVGHSMGGLLIRVFADLYPGKVAGMVLVDASHPEQYGRSQAIRRHMSSGFRMLKSIPLLAKLGYVRLTGFFDSWPIGLPEQHAAEAEAFLSSYCHLKTTRDESLAWDAICAEVRCTRGLGEMPLAVVSAGKDVLPGAPELQAELAALSSNSIQLAVKDADHVTLVTHREHALSVVEAIHHVVETVKLRYRRGG